MWLPYAIISTVSSGFRRVYDKSLSGRFGNFSFGFLLNFFAIVPIAIMVFFLKPADDILNMPWQFWWPLIVSVIFQYPLQNYLYIRAIREGELSSVVPLMALLPAFNAVTSFFLVGERPTFLGIIGIFTIVLGTYLMLKKKEAHVKLRPELFMILSMVIAAFGSSLDKVALGVAEPVFYSLVSTVATVLVLLPFMYFAGELKDLKKMHAAPGHLVIVGCLFAISIVSLEIAFSHGPTSYVLALRSGNLFIGALWGFFALKEQLTQRKLLAILCFIIGSVLLAFA